jgi:hypothetical protein
VARTRRNPSPASGGIPLAVPVTLLVAGALWWLSSQRKVFRPPVPPPPAKGLASQQAISQTAIRSSETALVDERAVYGARGVGACGMSYVQRKTPIITGPGMEGAVGGTANVAERA